MSLRIAVLGAGPVGLEAALYARALGYHVTAFEAGSIGENLERWGHATLFSPWKMNHTPLGLLAARRAGPTGKEPGPDDLITGREHRRLYLEPLSRSPLLQGTVRERHRIISVGREGLLKGDGIGDVRRSEAPFRLLMETPDGEVTVAADRVLDATGSYGHPNWVGSGGIPAAGERAARSRISYLLDDPLGADCSTYRGKRTMLVGSGFSAATSLVALRHLRDEDPSTSVLWVTRSVESQPYAPVPNDPLPGRALLIEQVNALASCSDSGFRRLPGRSVQAVEGDEEGVGVTLRSLTGDETHRVDRILANVGYRPDRSIYSELQIHECYASGGPMKLAAALLSRDFTDCLAQTGHGPETLLNPEPGFFILGAKSYGRNSHFLMRIGFEQIREIFRIVAGRRDLDLYARRQEVSA